MLKINFEAETDLDTISPINVANALINHDIQNDKKTFTVSDLMQIAEHLLVYCNHNLEGYKE